MTQTIQIPASMAGHQLVALQMPDGRQQIFALQGNQTLQMIQTPAGLQQVNIEHPSICGWKIREIEKNSFRFNKLFNKALVSK